jgi:hypothetical protein
MSRLGSYKNTAFNESQKFLVLDPSTSSASLVLASELVAYITPKIGSVKAESTRLSAENTDYKVGEIIQTSGATVVGSLAAVYLVVAGGAGDFPMLNGNDLLVLIGDDALRAQLISQTAGQGASLVSMEDGPTVEVAVNNRVIRVSNRTEMKTYDVPADYQFSLEEGGRSGLFVVKSGTPPADPQEGVYVVLTNGEYVERLYSGPLNSAFFGAAPGGTDSANRTAVQAAIALIDLLGGGTVLNPSGIRFGVLNNDATTYPDFSAASTDIIVEDHGPADANIGGDKAGSQLRYFQYTEQTSPVGQHNGNGIRTTGDWAPYFWADNTEVLAAQGDPSRTATDNRRASIFFATRGVANWRIGQGNTSGDFTESELTAFLIAVNGLPDLGVSGLTTMLSFLKTNGNFGINTGAPNASVHIASRAGQSPVFRLDGSPSTGNLRLILDQDVTTSEIQVTPTDTRLLVGGSTVLQAFTNGNVLTNKGISGGSFTTTQRNALGSLQGGTMVFDSTLGIPIWKPSTGTGTWVNASGTSV